MREWPHSQASAGMLRYCDSGLINNHVGAQRNIAFSQNLAEEVGQDWVSRHVAFTKVRVFSHFSGTCNPCSRVRNAVHPRPNTGPPFDAQLRDLCVID